MLEAIYITSSQESQVKSAIKKIKAISDIELKNSTSITFSIFQFKGFSEQEISKYRYSLFCPECLQIAYFRRASKDGKQACFGSRYHLKDCSELSTSKSKSTPLQTSLSNNNETTQKNELTLKLKTFVDSQKEEQVKKSPLFKADEQGFTIDFSAKHRARNKENKSKRLDNNEQKIKQLVSTIKEQQSENESANTVIKQSLSVLLKSLLKNSSLATSDVWVNTSEKHRWRAKNLFVNFSDAEVLDKTAPRMYWGTISHCDKGLLWLNVADAKNVSIPIKDYKTALLDQYEITENEDLNGAHIILFAKCVANKDQSRKFLTLWNNDLKYLYLTRSTYR